LKKTHKIHLWGCFALLYVQNFFFSRQRGNYLRFIQITPVIPRGQSESGNLPMFAADKQLFGAKILRRASLAQDDAVFYIARYDMWFLKGFFRFVGCYKPKKK